MADNYKDVCTACENIKKLNPDVIENGITEEMGASLKANTGLNPKHNHNNCTDEHDMNDCLLGGMIEKMPTYDTCDSLQALEDSLQNIMAMFDVMIYSDCGQWEQIEKLWEEINKIWDAIKDLQDRVSALEKATGTNTTNISLMMGALQKLLENLKNSGAWADGEKGIFDGNLVSGRNLATGNINLFGGTADGSSFIKTTNTKNENDIFAGGV